MFLLYPRVPTTEGKKFVTAAALNWKRSKGERRKIVNESERRVESRRVLRTRRRKKQLNSHVGEEEDAAHQPSLDVYDSHPQSPSDSDLIRVVLRSLLGLESVDEGVSLDLREPLSGGGSVGKDEDAGESKNDGDESLEDAAKGEEELARRNQVAKRGRSRTHNNHLQPSRPASPSIFKIAGREEGRTSQIENVVRRLNC